MKKLQALATISLAMALMLPIASYAERNINVTVDGKQITFPDATPYIDENNRVLIPIRAVADNMDAQTYWNEQEKLVTIKRLNNADNTKYDAVKLKIGENTATVGKINAGDDTNTLTDTKEINLDTKANTKENRTYVPIRFVSDALNAYSVNWDGKTSTVKIVMLHNPDEAVDKDKDFFSRLVEVDKSVFPEEVRKETCCGETSKYYTMDGKDLNTMITGTEKFTNIYIDKNGKAIHKDGHCWYALFTDGTWLKNDSLKMPTALSIDKNLIGKTLDKVVINLNQHLILVDVPDTLVTEFKEK